MDYFSKLTDEGELIVTSISDDSAIIVIKGDYIKIWELIKTSEFDHEMYKAAIADQDLGFLKPFFNFLHFNNFPFKVNNLIKMELLKIYGSNLEGSFYLFEDSMINYNFEVFAQACSPNGTGPYGYECPFDGESIE